MVRRILHAAATLLLAVAAAAAPARPSAALARRDAAAAEPAIQDMLTMLTYSVRGMPTPDLQIDLANQKARLQMDVVFALKNPMNMALEITAIQVTGALKPPNGTAPVPVACGKSAPIPRINAGDSANFTIPLDVSVDLAAASPTLTTLTQVCAGNDAHTTMFDTVWSGQVQLTAFATTGFLNVELPVKKTKDFQDVVFQLPCPASFATMDATAPHCPS